MQTHSHLLPQAPQVHKNLSIEDLIKKALERKEVHLSKTGALVVYTGKYTGRSPKDKFIVDTQDVHDEIDWGNINMPISESSFDALHKKMMEFLAKQNEIFVFDGFVGADVSHRLGVRVVSEYAYQSLFAHHLFRRPTKKELANHSSDITVICAPGCIADVTADGTNSEAFIILHIPKKIVLIGGTKYAGEIKKSVFSLMNYLLPKKQVMPMHASANMAANGDTAIFFGLSGTGKTTLSADKKRDLIGDDEHGWSEKGVFNFEGGCYAKCINLQKNSEPLIWDAIRDGALVENVVMTDTGDLDFADSSLTENTRVAYPIHYIERTVENGKGNHPSTIIFLTADAFGVLPPVAKLSIDQAIYHFLSGYTSKLAGTERGIKEPKATFSAYFGAPFMPHKPKVYADLLRKFLEKYKSRVYLVNTGWIGGPYGVGKRISIEDTRTIVRAILDGKLDKKKYQHDSMFNLSVPFHVPGVADTILHPRNLWKSKTKYDKKAKELVALFSENFKKFTDLPVSVKESGPKLS